MEQKSVAERDADDVEQSADAVAIRGLGPSIMRDWQAAANHRQQTGMDDELIECLRQQKSEYSPADKAKILESGQPLIYIPLSDLKRRTAVTMVRSAFINSADPSWTFDPSPVPDLAPEDSLAIAKQTILDYIEWKTMELMAQGVPADQAEMIVMSQPVDPLVAAEYARSRRDENDRKRTEQATRKVERMYKKCQDQTLAGGLNGALSECVDYAATFGTAILQGPIRRRKLVTVFKRGRRTVGEKEVLAAESIHPMDAYPSKGAVSINDGDFFAFRRYTPKTLSAMSRGGDGYFPEAIERILEAHPNGGLTISRYIDSERKTLENDGAATAITSSALIDGIEFWGDRRGSELIEQGITETLDGKKIDDDVYYEVNAIVVGNEIVYCRLINPEFGRMLYKAVFYNITGSWWGESPMKKIRDLQRDYNHCKRALAWNNACSSGPQMVVGDVARLASGYELKMKPYGIIGFTDPAQRGDIPVKFFQAGTNAPELIAQLRETEKLMDTVSGIPAYSHGSDSAAGAGRTYNGLLLIVTASKEGINDVVVSMFNDMLKPYLENLYAYNLIYDEDEDIKGDLEVKAGGLLAILLREQNANKLMEFLNLAQNPNVMSVIGEAGLAELLRQVLKLLPGINPDNVVPSKSEMERRQRMAEIEARLQQAAQMQAAAPQPIGSPAVATGTENSAPNGQAGLPPFRPAGERGPREA